MTTTLNTEPEIQNTPQISKHALTRLYHGQTAFNFVGRFKIWGALSLTVIILGLISVFTQGLNFSIDFRGGTSWTVLAPSVSVNQVRATMTQIGLPDATVQKLGGRTITVDDRIDTGTASQIAAKKTEVTDKLAALAHVSKVDGVSIQDVGPTWGGYITNKAVEALVVFLILITLYITVRFEWKMAVAALVALLHDILVTIGIYSLSGFQVTPDTVVAFLTILGYSLYDTMVVFDRVQDNTDGIGASGRMTYSSIVNLSMNQVLARSINTSIVAIMPILSVLVIGAQVFGATTLQYFGLALFIGLTTGAYSSIFIASPLVAKLKESEGRYKTIRTRLEARGEADLPVNPYSGIVIAQNRRNPIEQFDPNAPTDLIRPSKRAKRTGSTIKQSDLSQLIRPNKVTAQNNIDSASKKGAALNTAGVDDDNSTDSEGLIDAEVGLDSVKSSDSLTTAVSKKSQNSNANKKRSNKSTTKAAISQPKSAKKRR